MKHKGDNENTPDGLGVLMSAYDWKEAMKYAKFKFSDIKKVIVAKEGENEGGHWKLVVELKDDTFGWLLAWCDYSGWGCQEGGDSGICDTEEKAIKEVELKE